MQGAERAPLPVLLDVRLHHAKPGQRLLRLGGQRGEPGLDAFVVMEETRAQPRHEDREHRKRHERQQGESRVDPAHEEHRHHEGRGGAGEVHDPRAQQIADPIQIVRRPRHEIPHLARSVDAGR